MEAFLIHNLAPIMFGSLVIVLLLGYPAAFSLAFVGLFLRACSASGLANSSRISCRRCRSASTA